MPDRAQRKRRNRFALGGALALLAGGFWFAGASTPIGDARAAGACAPAPAYLATAEEPTGGIGGTGHSPGDREGGIGGTGIVGTVTGFASVCVNGVEVHYDDNVPVSENGKTSSVRALAVGQVVAMDAVAGARGLTARRIEVVHALEGPVTRNAEGRFEVMGAEVVAAHAVVRSGIGPLQAGEWVQVSGHRDQAGRWVATRVARIEARGEVSLQGSVDAADRIAGVRVDGESLASGSTRLVRGEWRAGPDDAGGRLRIRESAVAPVVAIVERAERLIVETRVRDARDGRVRTGHPEFDVALAGRVVRDGELVRVRAHRGADGRIVADRVERSTRERDDRQGGDRRDDAGGREDRDQERDQNRDRSGERDRESGDRELRDGRERERPDRNGERTERSERSERLERNEQRTERAERRERD